MLHKIISSMAYLRGSRDVEAAPMISAIELTNRCNLQCVMCPRGEPNLMERQLGIMQMGLFKKILRQARAFPEVLWLHLFGEPLLVPNLSDYIRCAKDLGVPNVGISTNATLLGPKRADELFRSGLDTLIISIDGTSKEVYEKIRKSSAFSFEEVRTNAERFLAMKKRLGRGPRTILSIIHMQQTDAELERFTAYWVNRGADEVVHKGFSTWGNQSDHFDGLGMSSSVSGAARALPCTSFWKCVAIHWNGTVVPCCQDYDEKEPLGNLNEQTLTEIWNGPALRRLRTLEESGRNESPLCKKCPGVLPRASIRLVKSIMMRVRAHPVPP